MFHDVKNLIFFEKAFGTGFERSFGKKKLFCANPPGSGACAKKGQSITVAP
jgi:hypothetical protein